MAIGAIMGQQKANPQLSNLSNNQQALYNIGAGVRPNLLDNWYFAGGGTTGAFPINQRGQTSYAVNGEYSIDRWRMENYQSVLTLTLQSDCIRLQKTSTGFNPGVYQILSNQDLIGKTATISVIYRGTGLSNVKISPPGLANGYIFQDSAEWTLTSSTYTIAAGDVGTISNQVFVGFQIMEATQTSDYLEVLAIKLELGENQTLAYQDANGNWNLLPQPEQDYVIQLLKCQRYLNVLQANNTYSTFGNGLFVNNNTAHIFIPLSIPLRTLPTISYSGTFGLVLGAGSNLSVSNILIDQYSSNGIRLAVTISTTTTVGKPCYLNAKNDSTAQIILSAEL